MTSNVEGEQRVSVWLVGERDRRVSLPQLATDRRSPEIQKKIFAHSVVSDDQPACIQRSIDREREIRRARWLSRQEKREGELVKSKVLYIYIFFY